MGTRIAWRRCVGLLGLVGVGALSSHYSRYALSMAALGGIPRIVHIDAGPLRIRSGKYLRHTIALQQHVVSAESIQPWLDVDITNNDIGMTLTVHGLVPILADVSRGILIDARFGSAQHSEKVCLKIPVIDETGVAICQDGVAWNATAGAFHARFDILTTHSTALSD